MNTTFTNNPLVTDWMSPSEKLFRSNAQEFFARILNRHYPTNHDSTVTFFSTGVSSIVARVQLDDQSIVIKTILENNRALSEALALQYWNQHDINTPTIYHYGILDDYSYSVMEYCTEPTLEDLYTTNAVSLSQTTSILSQFLARISTTTLPGFGPIIESPTGEIRGTYATISDHYNALFTPELLSVLPSEYSIDLISSLIAECCDTVINQSPTAVVAPFDFAARHIFMSAQPKIFDPDAEAVPFLESLAFILLPDGEFDEARINFLSMIVHGYIDQSGQQLSPADIYPYFVLCTLYKAFRLLQLPSPERIARAMRLLDITTSKDRSFTHLGRFL